MSRLLMKEAALFHVWLQGKPVNTCACNAGQVL